MHHCHSLCPMSCLRWEASAPRKSERRWNMTDCFNATTCRYEQSEPMLRRIIKQQLQHMIQSDNLWSCHIVPTSDSPKRIKKAHRGKLWEALKKTTNCRSAALIISLCSKGSLLILLTSNVMAILLSLHTNGLQFLFQSLVFALCGLQGHQRTFQVLGFRDGKFA